MNRTSFFIILYGLFLTPAVSAYPSKAAIASAHPLATRAGFEILERGGNAFDAAVAVSAALAVVEPSGSGLGGGGFWLLHRQSDGKQVMLDGREKAPLAAHRDMYLDADGKVISGLSVNGALAAGIPGLPAAIVHLSRHYGRLPLAVSLDPAIQYARNGFVVGARFLRLLKLRESVISQSTAAAEIFFRSGKIPDPGFRLVQTDLAQTLSNIAEQGKAGFYQGEVSKKLVSAVRSGGGIWSQKDLDQYQVVERAPIKSRYKDVEITSASLPSSGGIVLSEALNILSHYPIDRLDKVSRLHLIVEALRRAFHDRALHLGDSDFVPLAVGRFLSLDYAAGLRSTIKLNRATSSDVFTDPVETTTEGSNTTHFSILDRDGNRVSATLSINFLFGSGFMAPGTGIFLNDEMDDFSIRPQTPNLYGLVGNRANAIAPGKRMLSSMTPTFLEDSDRIAILGTPGGSRIISMVLLAALDFCEGNGPSSWVWVPRFHHQFRPDTIQYEKGALTDDEMEGLNRLGHSLKPINRRYGNMQAVMWNKKTGKVEVASDPRQDGLGMVK